MAITIDGETIPEVEREVSYSLVSLQNQMDRLFNQIAI